MNACLFSHKPNRRLRKDSRSSEACPKNLRVAIFVAKRNLLQPNEDASDISKAILRVS